MNPCYTALQVGVVTGLRARVEQDPAESGRYSLHTSLQHSLASKYQVGRTAWWTNIEIKNCVAGGNSGHLAGV